MTYDSNIYKAIQSVITEPLMFIDEALASSSHKAMATKAANASKNAAGHTSAEQISKDVMASDRVIIPLERTSTPDSKVVAHLKNHGYDIAGDYSEGLVAHSSKPDRKMRIGKVLTSTEAPEGVKKAFEKDPARQGTRNENKASVVVSRRPSDVAAMSTHQSWQSCQTLGGTAAKDGVPNKQEPGSHKEQVPKIIGSGAHIAYLVKHPDDVDKHYKPIARVTLNPFVSSTSKHTILRPSNEYGDSWEGFHSTVKKWSEKNFPAKDPIYRRHSGAYQEGESTIHSYAPEHNEFWKKNSHDVKMLENHHDPEVLNHAAQEAFEKGHDHMIIPLLRNKNLPKESETSIVHKVANLTGTQSNFLKQEVVSKVSNPIHIDKILGANLDNGKIHHAAATNDHATSEQLHAILDRHGAVKTKTEGVRSGDGYHSGDIIKAVTRNKNSNDSHFRKILELKDFNHEEAPHKTVAAIDHHDALTEMAGKYHDEDVGKKLLDTVNQEDLHLDTQHIVSSVAEKHPHLLHVLPDQNIQSAYRKCSLNKNLENESLRRGTPSLLSTVAHYTKDKTLLGAMANHPDTLISDPAKIRIRHLEMYD